MSMERSSAVTARKMKLSIKEFFSKSKIFLFSELTIYYQRNVIIMEKNEIMDKIFQTNSSFHVK